jgi:hypothetical protein
MASKVLTECWCDANAAKPADWGSSTTTRRVLQPAPADPDEMRDAGWQVRNDYPVKFRCPTCWRRQDRETVAA